MSYTTFADVLADAVKALASMPREITEKLPADALAAFAALPQDAAEELALALVRTAAKKGHAGADYYLPSCGAFDRATRNAEIRKEFNGTNLRAVCRKWGVSKTTVYRACRRQEAA